MISIDVSEFSDADLDHQRRLYSMLFADAKNPRASRWCRSAALALLEELEDREQVLRDLGDALDDDDAHGVGGFLGPSPDGVI